MILPCGRANVESGSIFGNKYSARSGLHISLLCKEISTEGGGRVVRRTYSTDKSSWCLRNRLLWTSIIRINSNNINL